MAKLPTFQCYYHLFLQLLCNSRISPYANANCNATWHPQGQIKQCNFEVKFSGNVPHSNTGIGVNLSSPLHRKAQPLALFISSTSHKPNQYNPTALLMPTHGTSSKNLKNIFLQTYMLKKEREGKGRSNQAPLDNWLKSCVRGGASFSMDAGQLQPDPLIPRRHHRRGKGGRVGNIIKNRIICTGDSLSGA
jgi:hypothetical protein